MKELDENNNTLGELSERELLLLSNYMYLECSTEKASIKEVLDAYKNSDGDFDLERIKEIPTSGGLKAEEVRHIFEMMDSEDEEFKNLRVTQCVNNSGLRGSCFVSDGENKGANATIVFRGTGGTYSAWNDNVLGEYKADTDIQRKAFEFVKYDCGLYRNITVSGHSKGGNLAQYVTVTCPDKVDRCVSYDGQGFSDAFLLAHHESVEKASGKIKSISAYNDFVNILLTPIAGERIFVENRKGGINAHSSYWLLDSNTFDDEGDFISITDQSRTVMKMENSLANVVDVMDELPYRGNEKTSNMLAALTAAVMSDDKSILFETGRIVNSGREVRNYLGTLINPHVGRVYDISVKIRDNEMTFNDINTSIKSLKSAAGSVKEACSKVNDTQLKLDYSISTRRGTYRSLNKLSSGLEECAKNLNEFAECGEEILSMYEDKEKDIINNIYYYRA